MRVLNVVGIGPGDYNEMTYRAVKTIKGSDIIVGYTTYINLLKDLIEGKRIESTTMTKEIERCIRAIELTKEGEVSVVSSGDSGVYGMAGVIIELVDKFGLLDEVKINIIPGVTSANASASLLGAPLMHDFGVLSLSDYLTPLDLIYKRAEHLAMGDFVCVLYNPKSKARKDYLKNVIEIFKKHRKHDEVVGVVNNAYRDNQAVKITTLNDIDYESINMFSTVIIGNSKTKKIDDYMLTPRGYDI